MQPIIKSIEYKLIFRVNLLTYVIIESNINLGLPLFYIIIKEYDDW